MPTMKSRIIPFLTLTACLCFHVIVAEEENDDVSDGFEDDDEEEDDEDFSYLCKDQHEDCPTWADEGECFANPRYMKNSCKKSCNTCLGEDAPNDPDILFQRGGDIGVEQKLFFLDGTREEDIQWILGKARNYMTQIVPDKFEEGMDELCKNQREECAYWAFMGECKKNADYMKVECGPVCSACEALTLDYECPLDPPISQDAWKEGDLNKMFEKLTSEPYKSQYSVEILSSPETNGPWVIQMDDVVSEKEAWRLIELGEELGYERSTEVGRMNADGTLKKVVNTQRTSTNAWCDDICYEDEYASAVIDRLSLLTGINETNSEDLQLLRYETGQKYGVHHDFVPMHLKRQSGPRILTFYLYLNDVEEGGGTNFDKLDITVMPKRGRALLWPSVMNGNPQRKDRRTTHQALPVLSGVKFGVNAWFHLRDFKTVSENGCI